MSKSQCFFKGFTIFFLLAAASPAYSSADTSYGDYRVKEKEKERTGGGGSRGSQCRNCDDDTSSCLSGCFEGCFQTGFDVLGEIIKEIGSSYESAPGELDYYQFAEPGFRYALGAGAGVLGYTGISTGFQIKAFNHFYVMPSHAFNLRANLGFDFSINSIRADFERDVFVDTVKIGTQTIATSSYDNVSIPLLAELVFRPSGKNGSFHFVAGGGASAVYERIVGVKSVSNNTLRIDTAYSAFHIRPALSLGLGWFTVPGKKFGNIELYYKACFGRLDRKEPLPGENRPYSHSIALEFSVIF